MNTVVKVNGFEIEISGGLNDAFVKVINHDGEVIADLQFDHDMPVLKKKEVEHVYIKITADEKMEKWQKANKKVQARVSHLDKVYYSAYDNDDSPNDNLDEVAVVGATKIMWDNAWVQEDGTKFIPRVIENPTWLELAEVANEAIEVTGDNHHIYFEGIALDEKNGGYQLRMGS